MTEQNTNNTTKKGSLILKITVVIILLIVAFVATKQWKKSTVKTNQTTTAHDHDVLGLADEYSAQENADDVSDLTINEMREKGAEFVYQTLLKNQTKIDDLYTQIQNLKNEVTKYRNQEKIGKMIVIYVDLRDKIFAGKNYTSEMKSFEILSASDEVLSAKLNKLKPALTNFAVREHLEKDFADLIPEIVFNKKKNLGSESFLDKVRRNISRLVVIRRVDSKNPQDVDAVVVRIEKSLKQENYQEALSAALSLDQNYHAILKSFLDELSSALEVQQTDQEILNYLKSLS